MAQKRMDALEVIGFDFGSCDKDAYDRAEAFNLGQASREVM